MSSELSERLVYGSEHCITVEERRDRRVRPRTHDFKYYRRTTSDLISFYTRWRMIAVRNLSYVLVRRITNFITFTSSGAGHDSGSTSLCIPRLSGRRGRLNKYVYLSLYFCTILIKKVLDLFRCLGN